jgi:hypothetical protein
VTAAVLPVHIPEEPRALGERWLDEARSGRSLDEVLGGADGVSAWLWSRWRALATTGLDRPSFDAVVVGYRRELWLWLAGERTWEQCCSGLIGRLDRRLPPGAAAGA